jgi:pyridinium-3,5-biscarboxylic acid mononucleotide sulfurtransferase
VRVRHHGELARIEVAREELPSVLSTERFEAITAALKPLGFKFIALDMEGYRSGSMNSVLPLSALQPAR